MNSYTERRKLRESSNLEGASIDQGKRCICPTCGGEHYTKRENVTSSDVRTEQADSFTNAETAILTFGK